LRHLKNVFNKSFQECKFYNPFMIFLALSLLFKPIKNRKITTKFVDVKKYCKMVVLSL